MKAKEPIDQVFEALSDIKKNLDQQIRSLDEQIRSAQLEYLENAFQQQKDAFADCIDGIDQQLINLWVYLEEYHRLYASIRDLNEKIPELGGKPPVMPEHIAGDSLVEVLAGRFDYSKSQGKIRDL
jgi:hypothetical protein